MSDSYGGYREQISDRRLSRCQAWRPDGEPLPLEPSLLVVSHSPTGFEWGYLGTGRRSSRLPCCWTIPVMRPWLPAGTNSSMRQS